MFKNRKKGVALVSALGLMIIVLIFTSLMFTIVLGFSIQTKINDKNLKKNAQIAKIYTDFVKNGQIDGTYSYDIEVLNPTENQRAVVVYSNSQRNLNNIVYICAYDFLQNKTLASQKSNFALTVKEYNGVNYYYILDTIRFREV